jgi:hypothetical protein
VNKGVENIKAGSGVKLFCVIPSAVCVVDMLRFAFLCKKQEERDV